MKDKKCEDCGGIVTVDFMSSYYGMITQYKCASCKKVYDEKETEALEDVKYWGEFCD